MRRAAADIECTLNEIARLQNPFRIGIAPTTTSIVCSLKRSSFRTAPPESVGRRRKACRTPGAPPSALRRCEIPSALSRAARALQRPSFTAVSSWRTIAATLCFSTGKSQSGQNCVPVFATGAGENVNLGDRGDGRLAPARVTRCSMATLGGTPSTRSNVRLFQLLHELPCIRRHAVEKSSLPFSEEDVERDCRLPSRSSP